MIASAERAEPEAIIATVTKKVGSAVLGDSTSGSVMMVVSGSTKTAITERWGSFTESSYPLSPTVTSLGSIMFQSFPSCF